MEARQPKPKQQAMRYATWTLWQQQGTKGVSTLAHGGSAAGVGELIWTLLGGRKDGRREEGGGDGGSVPTNSM